MAGQGFRVHQLLLLAILIFTLFHQTGGLPSARETPLGCDDFGYQRQAALFRENNLGGFDTRIETPSSRRLIEVAKATGEDVRSWYQAIAPHCHHYRAAMDRVILQYPPGTGLLMVPFPQDVERRWFRFVCVVAAAAALALLLARATRLAEGLVVLGGAALVLISFKVGTDSAYAAIAFSVFCGLLLAPALRPGGLLPLAALGLIAGFSSTIRVTNLLIVAVVGFVLVVQLLGRRTRAELAAILVFTAASLAGLLPLLWANLVNAGSVFSTTYSEIDASAPVLSWDLLQRGLEFYFRDNSNGFVLGLALVLGLATCVARWRSAAVWVAVAVMALSIAYMVPKQVLIPYYLMAPAGLLITACLVAMIERTESELARRWSIVTAFSFPAIVLAVGLVALRVVPLGSQRLALDPAVVERFAGDPIVWGDVYGSAVVALYRTYSAKLMFASPEIQEALVAGTHAAGIEQFFLVDTESMTKVFDRIRLKWSLEPAGDVFGKPLYRLSGPFRTE
jgi:hypothetical protein